MASSASPSSSRLTTTVLAALGAAAILVTAARAAERLADVTTRATLGPAHFKRRFCGHWALVTGTSAGVGRALACALARRGVHVALVARRRAELDALARELEAKHSVRALVIVADLNEPGGVDAVVDALNTDVINDLRLVICNAGGAVTPPLPYWQWPERDVAACEALNGAACTHLVRALLPRMLQTCSPHAPGAVVAVSSLAAARDGSAMSGAFLAPYAAEKARLEVLFAALDAELQLESGADGPAVRARALVLGPVLTLGLRAATDAGADAAPTLLTPSADAAAEAMVAAIGVRGGGPAVVTPYLPHALVASALASVWPGCLARALQRTVARNLKASRRGFG